MLYKGFLAQVSILVFTGQLHIPPNDFDWPRNQDCYSPLQNPLHKAPLLTKIFVQFDFKYILNKFLFNIYAEMKMPPEQ